MSGGDRGRALPRSLDDLRGLRAARWIRESTAGQIDRFGPDAQREQQDRAIERYGLQDTGLSWLVAHSGYRKDRAGIAAIASTTQWAEMLAGAGERYDVLVVGYVSRFARDAEVHFATRRQLHAAGASLLFVDERVLSSDEDSWEVWARETVESEAYSRRLGKRIREGYSAKFRREADQGGNAPIGFLRSGRSRTLAIDPDTIGRVVALFERYATGTISVRQLAEESGLMMGHVAEVLKNPVYNGWVRRGTQRAAAPWRSDPPVSDALWERVAHLRDRRSFSKGRARTSRVDPLRGLLFCSCGATIRAWGTDRAGGQRRAHPYDRTCDQWGGQTSYLASTWLPWLEGQVRGLQLDDATIAAVVAALDAPAPQASLARARLERERRELALDHAAGRLADRDYLDAAAALRSQEAAIDDDGIRATRPADAVAYLRALAATWDNEMEPQERADLMAAIYERVEVRGPEFVSVELTEAAYRHGLAVALPEEVGVVMVSPEGVALTLAKRVPIRWRDRWLHAARRSA